MVIQKNFEEESRPLDVVHDESQENIQCRPNVLEVTLMIFISLRSTS